MALPGRLARPAKCLGKTFLRLLAIRKLIIEVLLSVSYPLLGGLPEPAHGLGMILPQHDLALPFGRFRTGHRG